MRRAEVRETGQNQRAALFLCHLAETRGRTQARALKSRCEAMAFYNRKKIERARYGTETELLSGRENKAAP